jgi:hypothetical protein|tara:strand:+ start:427 stop:1092 length:666 start_codon:yes stop_codon:yes gene_type:complete
MNISTETLNVLKNFSSISPSLVVKTGSILRTISPMKNIYAKFTSTEVFQKDFALYDLNEFLGGLSLFKDPEFAFDETHIKIKSGRCESMYFYSDASVITAPPEKDIDLPSEDVTFQLSDEDLNSLLKASSVYQLPDLSLIGDGRKMNLVVRDKCNNGSNVYNVDVGETSSTFCFNFKVENLKILPGVYNVTISSPNLSVFNHTRLDLCYWIALEPDSTYES